MELRNGNHSDVDKSILIILCDYKPSLLQFKQIIDADYWDEIFYIWDSFSEKAENSIINCLLSFSRKKRLDKIIKQIKSSDFVVWGNLSSNWCHYFLKKNISDNPVSILDDGFATINLMNKINNGDSLLHHHGLINKSEHFCLNPPKKIKLNDLCFFSVFDISKSVNIKIEKNNYDYWKLKIKSQLSIVKKMYFVGQPLVFLKILSKEQYSNILNQIFFYYSQKGYKCYYLPHRSCVLDYLDPNWEIIQYEMPLEYILINKSEDFPQIFATFYSTAVYNLSRLFDQNDISFHYWNINNHELFNKYSNNIFAYLESNPIERQQIYLTSRLN